ncbi:MAG: hypothetical protein GYB64_02055, partial [Chloroflexi bacterium]|nr:hypothetical protein [Chloroflexota bacterium]
LVIVSLLAGIPLGHRVAVGEDEPVSVPAGVAGGVRTLIVGLFFVTLLYSIIGLPTGLGGLIIRRFQTLEVPVGPLALVFGIALVLDLLVGVVHTALAVIAARSAAAYKDAVDEDAARMAPPPAPDLDSPPEEPDASNPPEDSSV